MKLTLLEREAARIAFIHLSFEAAGTGGDWGEKPSQSLRNEVREALAEMSDEELIDTIRVYADDDEPLDFNDLVDLIAEA